MHPAQSPHSAAVVAAAVAAAVAVVAESTCWSGFHGLQPPLLPE